MYLNFYFYFVSALSKYFETMPLPNVISWYAHHFPAWFLKTVTVLAEVNDLFVPMMFLIPVRSIKKIAFYIQVISVLFYNIFLTVLGLYNNF